jgi:hypothetical protein
MATLVASGQSGSMVPLTFWLWVVCRRDAAGDVRKRSLEWDRAKIELCVIRRFSLIQIKN